MPTLRTVEFWPATGFLDRPWQEDPAEDAWVKSARRVCELYSEALADHELPAHVSSLRMFVRAARDRPAGSVPTVAVTPHLEPVREGFEMASLTVPAEIVDLTPLARARVVLESIGVVMASLATARGWPRTTAEAVGRAVLDRGLHFDWTGRAVQDRRRRLRARTSFHLADDGFGRVQVDLHDARTDEWWGVSRELVAYSTVEGFRRASKSLHWQGADAVVLQPFSDAFGLDETQVTLRVPTDFTPPPRLEPRLHDTRTSTDLVRVDVSLTGRSSPSIVYGGGGPMNDVPRRYDATVDWLFEHIPAEVTAWWRGTGLTMLEVSYEYWGNSVTVRLRRKGEDLLASIRRPMPDPAATAEPVRTAHEDVTNVLRSVQRRFRLGQPPALPLPAESELDLHVHEDADDALPFALADLGTLLPPEILALLQAHASEGDDY